MHRAEALLVLEDGTAFAGEAFTAEAATVAGEVVFNTAMGGYQEVLTDPSYAGQLVCMAAPEVGNYGTVGDDAESDRVQVAAFLVRQAARRPSSWRAERSPAEGAGGGGAWAWPPAGWSATCASAGPCGAPCPPRSSTHRPCASWPWPPPTPTAWPWSTGRPGPSRSSSPPTVRSACGSCSTTSGPRPTSPGGCAGSGPGCWWCRPPPRPPTSWPGGPAGGCCPTAPATRPPSPTASRPPGTCSAGCRCSASA